ncbi:hypothetical protein N8T08_001712 [Aspergillus melleus]|uniref:Uncharacterized protein n=1 Tax=Aspergillus melleus TaxID=138277 RepID=A0ACC3AMV1_9EURO|nr:hypothetical protein N8T08_001712 [Aspergillus melleus]
MSDTLETTLMIFESIRDKTLIQEHIYIRSAIENPDIGLLPDLTFWVKNFWRLARSHQDILLEREYRQKGAII